MYDLSSSSFLKSSISQKEQFSNGAILKWSIFQMEHFSNGAILKSNISQMEHFSNEAILKSNISQMEHFSNGAILKSNISQMEQFSNGAFWGRHPMPYFKIPRTEKYGMRCASSNGDDNQIKCQSNLGLSHWTYLAPIWRAALPIVLRPSVISKDYPQG